MTFDTTPKPEFLRAMMNQSWSVGGALSELVDNSFGSGRGNAHQVHITHDTKNRTITVLDDGEGMEAIGRLFQLGNTIGRKPGDIGIYGAGGTMAILWLPRKVDVCTLRDGRVSHDSVTWSDEIRAERFPAVSDEWRPSTLANTPGDLYKLGHGTRIHLHLANERQFYPSNVKRDLARNYAPAFRHGKQLTWTTIGKGGGTETLADPMAMPDDPNQMVTFDLTVTMGDDLLGAHGVVGVIPDLPQDRSRVSIGFGPRVITRTRDCYTSPDGTERYAGTGIGGWLDLGDGWQPYLATTKDGVNDTRAWDALMGYIFAKIQPLLEQVERQKISIELEEIGLMLESVLDGTQVDVLAAGKRHRDETGDERIRLSGPGESDEKQDPTIPARQDPIDGDGEDTTRPDTVASRLEIIDLDNEAMEDLLCYAEQSSVGFNVYVNRDHELIKEAMKSKPINRELLHLLVLQQVAVEFADDEGLLRKAFRPQTVRRFEDREGRQRERLITRYLLDRVKRTAA